MKVDEMQTGTPYKITYTFRGMTFTEKMYYDGYIDGKYKFNEGKSFGNSYLFLRPKQLLSIKTNRDE